MVVLLLVSVTGTVADGGNVTQFDGAYWATLDYGEKVAYVDGFIAGSYALALVYMEDNPGLGGPDMFGYATLGILDTVLVDLLDRVYRMPKFKAAPIAAILINAQLYLDYLGR